MMTGIPTSLVLTGCASTFTWFIICRIVGGVTIGMAAVEKLFTTGTNVCLKPATQPQETKLLNSVAILKVN